MTIYILSSIIIFIILLALLITYICFRIVFYVPRKQELSPDAIPLPEGEIYEPYHPLMENWILEARSFPHKNCYIKSHDGLTLHAKYFEYEKTRSKYLYYFERVLLRFFQTHYRHHLFLQI